MKAPSRVSFDEWQRARPLLCWAYEGVPQSGTSRMTCEPSVSRAWLLLAGDAEARTRGGVVNVGQGQACVLPPGRTVQRFAEGTRLVSVGFKAEWGDGRALFTEPVVGRASPKLREAGSALAVLAARAWRRGRDHPINAEQCARLMASFSGWLAELVAFVERTGVVVAPAPREVPRLRRAVDMLEAEEWACECPLEQAARAARLGRRHLDRMLVARYGMTARRLWDRVRATRAAARLAHEREPCKVLAADLGFANAAEFSRWFRRHHGVSPRQHRLGNRAG